LNSIYRVLKKNHDALAQLGKRFELWLRKYGVSSKIYYLNNNQIIINRRSDY
jgi:hypothetical protein